jgi:hypothetical protein
MASSFTSYSDLEYLNFLHVVQAFLGDIDWWPSRILNLLFIVEYNHQNVTETAAFFYGNKGPLGEAVAFYIQCNDHNTLRTVIHFTLLYKAWKTRPVVDPSTCVCTYYDTRLKTIHEIHPPQPDSSGEDIHLGVDITGHGDSIRARLTLMFG